MRIGTWNLDNRWDDRHLDLLLKKRCDVWLLTEVNPQAVNPSGKIAGFHCHLSSGTMGCKQHWAGILSLGALRPIADPHPASAAAIVNGITFCSTVLPWSTCGKEFPWVGSCLVEKTADALSSLLAALPHKDLVWGGDWNQNLKGGWEYVGTNEGQKRLKSEIRSLNLQVPTADLPHRNNVSHSIDHIAVPVSWTVKRAERVAAENGGKRLSDHDVYIIEVDEPKC